jgi:hypothetical protein
VKRPKISKIMLLHLKIHSYVKTKREIFWHSQNI